MQSADSPASLLFAPIRSIRGPLRRVPKVVSLSLEGDPRDVSASFSVELLGSV